MKEKRGASNRRNMAGKSSVLIFVCYAFVAGGWAKPSAADAEALATPVVVNRTLPKVSPPKRTGILGRANDAGNFARAGV